MHAIAAGGRCQRPIVGPSCELVDGLASEIERGEDGIIICCAMTDEFIIAACVPCSDHASGTLDDAEAILAAHPQVAARDIYAAAIRGDADAVRRLLSHDPGRATAPGGPYNWDALTYLCFSRYLRVRGSDGFVAAAVALLDAGADPNTGFFEPVHEPEPTFESALYGAAGVAHHAGLTRLLFARGADPNLGSAAVWRGRTATVRLLLARGARVSADVLSLAERALTEVSEWTPHHSREIIDALALTASHTDQRQNH